MEAWTILDTRQEVVDPEAFSLAELPSRRVLNPLAIQLTKLDRVLDTNKLLEGVNLIKASVQT